MKLFDDYVSDNGFVREADAAYGTYSDMHIVVKQAEDVLSVYLYLSLPAAGRRERRVLEETLKEKGERFSATVGVSAHPSFLRIDFANDETQYKPVERFLNECDILLRPYGREMGIICAFCKKELSDEKIAYKREGDMIVPVCEACSVLESGDKVKRNANRRDFNRKRARRSIAGFCLGFLLCMGIHTLLAYSAGFYSYIIAMGCPFLLRYTYERFGGTFAKLKDKQVIAVLSVACVLALIFGSAVGNALNVQEYVENLSETTQYMEAIPEETMIDFDAMRREALGYGAFPLSSPIGQLASAELYINNLVPMVLTVFGAVFCVRRGFRR